MKEAIFLFIFAMVVTCLVGSLDPSLKPYPWPVSINGVKDSGGFGVNRSDPQYGEVNYVDKPRTEQFMTTIDEKSEDRNSGTSFPLGANN